MITELFERMADKACQLCELIETPDGFKWVEKGGNGSGSFQQSTPALERLARGNGNGKTGEKILYWGKNKPNNV